MQISLKDLLAIVAICGGFLWCAAEVGFDNRTFQFVAFIAALMSALFFARATSQNRFQTAWRVPAAFLAFGVIAAGIIVSAALFFDAVALIVLGFWVKNRQAEPPKKIAFAVAIIGLIAFVVGTAPGISQLRSLEQLRERFPITSVENKLAYESKPQGAKESLLALDSDVLKALDKDDERFDNSGELYRRLFSRIHDRTNELFIRSVGFGVGRMTRFVPSELNEPPLTDIHFNDRSAGSGTALRVEASNSAESIHETGRYDFINAETFGKIIEPKTKIIGFQSHGFHGSPVANMSDSNSWSLERLELVSLLKFDTPRVYVLDHLPRMDQLSGDNVPTRELDEFETGALAKLWTDSDLVVEHTGPDYRMLGSLRAAKACLNCHSAQRGELLGAFSYRLRHSPETME